MRERLKERSQVITPQARALYDKFDCMRTPKISDFDEIGFNANNKTELMTRCKDLANLKNFSVRIHRYDKDYTSYMINSLTSGQGKNGLDVQKGQSLLHKFPSGNLNTKHHEMTVKFVCSKSPFFFGNANG